MLSKEQKSVLVETVDTVKFELLESVSKHVGEGMEALTSDMSSEASDLSEREFLSGALDVLADEFFAGQQPSFDRFIAYLSGSLLCDCGNHGEAEVDKMFKAVVGLFSACLVAKVSHRLTPIDASYEVDGTTVH